MDVIYALKYGGTVFGKEIGRTVKENVKKDGTKNEVSPQ